MPANQLEYKSIVIEIVPKTIHPVMAFETILSERYLVLHHEGNIHGDITFTTGKHIEPGDILPVTICAQERLLLSRELVTVQFEARHIVRKSPPLQYRK